MLDRAFLAVFRLVMLGCSFSAQCGGLARNPVNRQAPTSVYWGEKG